MEQEKAGGRIAEQLEGEERRKAEGEILTKYDRDGT